MTIANTNRPKNSQYEASLTVISEKTISAALQKLAFKIAITQKQAIMERTRHDVTTCLYLKRSNRARSLSTLMAADVKADTASNMSKKKSVM